VIFIIIAHKEKASLMPISQLSHIMTFFSSSAPIPNTALKATPPLGLRALVISVGGAP
jgi:hypothetical protein